MKQHIRTTQPFRPDFAFRSSTTAHSTPTASLAPTGTTPPTGQVQPPMLSIAFEIDPKFAPALRSAIEEISNEVGGRLEGQHTYAVQDALTYAAIGLGALRAAVNRAVPAGDPDYKVRKGRG